MGVFSDRLDFLVWFFCNQSVFYGFGRLFTVLIVITGLGTFAYQLKADIGSFAASLITVGFVYVQPAMAELPYLNPHGALIGFSAFLVASTIYAANRPRSYYRWSLCGIIVGAAFSSMTVGLGLGLLPAWVLLFQEESESPCSQRLKYLLFFLGGILIGVLLFGYTIILHPLEYWNDNILYQLQRQVKTIQGGKGQILLHWIQSGWSLWLLAITGWWFGQFEKRSLATGALLTALGYISVLTFATSTQKINYSLALIPCLSYCTAGLFSNRSSRRTTVIVAIVLVLIHPWFQASQHVYNRLFHNHFKTDAKKYVFKNIPKDSVILVDNWWGTHFQTPSYLLDIYGERGNQWLGNKRFRNQLKNCLPGRDQKYQILSHSPISIRDEDITFFNEKSVEYLVIGKKFIDSLKKSGAWKNLNRKFTITLLQSFENEIFIFKTNKS